MRYIPSKQSIQSSSFQIILYFALAILVQLYSEIVLALPVHPSDSINEILPREKTLRFHSRCCHEVYIGDTLLMYPKRIVNGVIVDYPPEQHYEIRIIKGKEYATFVFPGGITSDDTSGVMLPIKLFVGERGAVQLNWEIFALQVDTSNDHLLRLMDIHEMIRRLSAPTSALKGVMVEHAGYFQLKLKNYEGARELFREAIILDSSLTSTYYYDFACAYARENKPTEALQWLQRAFDTGYDKYLKALKNDSDLVSIRSLPEFREIVTSPLVKERSSLKEKIHKDSTNTSDEYLMICKSYLKQADIDSFYIFFESMVIKKGYFPFISRFDIPDSIINLDPRIQTLFEQYAEQHKYQIYDDYWARMNPYIIRRLEISSHFDELSKCRNLVELRIKPKGIVSITPELACLEHLKTLRFIDCGFTSIPDIITRLTGLDTLTSDKGETSYLPNEFGNLINLKHLALHNGLLESLPPSFSKLSQLTDLSLDRNSFSAMPEVIFHISALDQLDISDNRLTSIPRAIGKLKDLTILDLSFNNLSVLPEEIGNLSQLTYLDLSFNELQIIPRSIRNLQSLQTLIVYGNHLDKMELDTLRMFLPHCNIYGQEQSIFKPKNVRNAKTYTKNSFEISFKYPAQYSLITKKESDSSEIVMSLALQRKQKKKSGSFLETSSYPILLTILFSRDHFEQIAGKFGFQRNQDIDRTKELEIDSSKYLPLWISHRRYRADTVAMGLSYIGWKGFFGTQYGNYFAFARKRLANGTFVYLIFSSWNQDDKLVFQNVLSTFHSITKQLVNKSKIKR